MTFIEFITKAGFFPRMSQWEFIRELNDETNKRIKVRKARQVGCTTILLYYALYCKLIKNEKALFCLFSYGGRDNEKERFNNLMVNIIKNPELAQYVNDLRIESNISFAVYPRDFHSKNNKIVIMDEASYMNNRGKEKDVEREVACLLNNDPNSKLILAYGGRPYISDTFTFPKTELRLLNYDL